VTLPLPAAEREARWGQHLLAIAIWVGAVRSGRRVADSILNAWAGSGHLIRRMMHSTYC
jgi:hypothetical protein